MAIYKCKICGGTLEVDEKQSSVVTCDYCGTKQTVYGFDNEKKINLFKRANALRYKCEFDKASGIYESIIAEFPKEAEAYWGLILCKYGIEYIDDPKTGNKIQTCHRTEFSSIFDDIDYKNAIKNANVLAIDIYKKEASIIDKLQKNILKIYNKTDPYDVFICYKETDAYGKRTEDSVLAEEIFNVLTSKGYKVFFSKISLENKLGNAYEPIIFSALHTSKVMLHVTTSSENSDSVWVRNEWQRYLNLIKNGDKKVLIPCYKNITPYELPDEMENLQGQDMSKLGYIQDLVRGIEKIVGKTKDKKGPSLSDEQELYEEYLKKAKLLLSKGLYNDAIQTYKNASKLVEKNGRAFLGILFAQNKVSTLKSFCSRCIKTSLISDPIFINAKNGVDDLSMEQISIIETKLYEKIGAENLKKIIHFLTINEWEEAEKLIKVTKFSERDLNFINETKYNYLKKICCLNDGSIKKHNISQLSLVNEMISLCRTFNSYKDVSKIQNLLEEQKEKICSNRKKETNSLLLINIPNNITLSSLFEVSYEIKMAQFAINNYPYLDSQESKQTYTDNLQNAIKWVVEGCSEYIKTCSYEEITYIEQIVSNLNNPTNSLSITKALNNAKDSGSPSTLNKKKHSKLMKKFIKLKTYANKLKKTNASKGKIIDDFLINAKNISLQKGYVPSALHKELTKIIKKSSKQR